MNDNIPPVWPPQDTFLAGVLASSLCGIYTYDFATNRFSFVSQRFSEITGWTLDRLSSMPEANATFLIKSEEQGLIEEQRQALQFLSDGDVLDLDFQFRTASGTYLVCQAREVTLERDAEGAVLRVLGSLQDVSERARALDERAEMERRLSMAMEGSGEGLWEWSIATGEAYYSSAWKKMLGHGDDFVLDSIEGLEALIHPDDLPSAWNYFRDFLRSGATRFERQFRIRHRDGHWLEVLARAGAQRDAEGRVTRITGTHIDITERKRFEDRLRESEERFRATFEQAAVGLALAGIDGSWIRVNRKLCDILGYTQDELSRLKFQDVTHPDDLDEDLVYLNQMLRREIATFSLEKRYIRRDSSVVWVNLTASLLWNPDGTPNQFVVVVENIDARKKVEQQLDIVLHDLQRSNAELQDYAYVASHDLRAPLTAVESLAEWLEEDLAGSITGRASEYPALIRKRIGRMKTLLDDLLEYSRAGDHAAEVREVDLQQVVNDMSAVVREREVITVQDVPLPVIRTRAAPLAQILRNLYSNAVKHHDREKCTIAISVEEKEDAYLFTVADDGPGISPEFRERVFGMFQTLRARDQVEASGMGLAIVKKLVQRYRGEVWIDSNLPRGVAVRFTWPKTMDWDASAK